MDNVYRIYKNRVRADRCRKDGSQLVKSYCCNGVHHVITYDHIWYDDQGIAVSGKANVKPPKYIGPCTNTKECKNFGFSLIEDNFSSFVSQDFSQPI